MTTFFLLRHAAHDNIGSFLAGRTDGIHLGTSGKLQAERLAIRMQREQFSAVYSSPRVRAKETALAVAKAAATGGITIADALDEIDFGIWSGQSFDTLDKDARWRRWNMARALAITPAGETMLMVQTRIVTFLSNLHTQGTDTAVVLVSHADVIKAAVIFYLGLCLDAWPRFEIAPASITTLKLEDWHSQIALLNEGVG